MIRQQHQLSKTRIREDAASSAVRDFWSMSRWKCRGSIDSRSVCTEFCRNSHFCSDSRKTHKMCLNETLGTFCGLVASLNQFSRMESDNRLPTASTTFSRANAKVVSGSASRSAAAWRDLSRDATSAFARVTMRAH